MTLTNVKNVIDVSREFLVFHGESFDPLSLEALVVNVPPPPLPQVLLGSSRQANRLALLLSTQKKFAHLLILPRR